MITYILLCGSRPFWARTESGIFRAVLRADPLFGDEPWPSVSVEAKDFVKRLLNKDLRRRMTAAQALSKWSVACKSVAATKGSLGRVGIPDCFLCTSPAHPWLRGNNLKVPLDILVYKLVRAYLRSSPMKRAALKVRTFMSRCAPFIWPWHGGGVAHLCGCGIGVLLACRPCPKR